MTRTWDFGGVRFYLDTADRYARTTLPDGSVVHARPNKDEGDTWHFHDFCHSCLSARLGLPHSPTLAAVAYGCDGKHEREDCPAPDHHVDLYDQYAEEGLVMAFVDFLHDGNPDRASLQVLAAPGDLMEMRADALALLRTNEHERNSDPLRR